MKPIVFQNYQKKIDNRNNEIQQQISKPFFTEPISFLSFPTETKRVSISTIKDSNRYVSSFQNGTQIEQSYFQNLNPDIETRLFRPIPVNKQYQEPVKHTLSMFDRTNQLFQQPLQTNSNAVFHIDTKMPIQKIL